jgi:hypothetical protein
MCCTLEILEVMRLVDFTDRFGWDISLELRLFPAHMLTMRVELVESARRLGTCILATAFELVVQHSRV